MQVINTNVMSLNSQRVLSKSDASLQTSLERLSSGLRINRAKDDAAGLAISERFTSQINGLNQAVRNANDGISLVQTTEGALEEVQNSLQRMRELAVQAANGTYNNSDRQSLQDEYAALASEITRITDVTEFNNINLMGQASVLSMQVGFENGANNIITISVFDVATAATSATQGGVASAVDGTATVSTATKAQSAMGILDKALGAISNLRGDFGAVQNRLESAVRNMQNVIENQSSARSRVRDTDFASETANLTRNQILKQAGTAMLSQANSFPQSVLSLLG